MTIITLLTDFGLQDPYVGIMKGVIWRIAPQVQIADLTHQISPQNVLEGALVLGNSTDFFPHGTVHLSVVDPGVGTPRRPLAAQIGSHYYVGPDNGLLTAVLEKAEQSGQPIEIVHLDQPKYWLRHVSHTFHGRDIFAPCAAYLANGTLLQSLGSPIHDPIRLALPRPERSPAGWRCQVVHIDHFGNLGTDLSAEQVTGQEKVTVRILDQEISGLVHSYGERSGGELVAMIDSTGHLAIAVVNGDAAGQLDARVGEIVDVIFQTGE